MSHYAQNVHLPCYPLEISNLGYFTLHYDLHCNLFIRWYVHCNLDLPESTSPDSSTE